MKTETSPAEVLAQGLARNAATFVRVTSRQMSREVDQDKNIIPMYEGTILREAKLRELCVLVVAVRKLFEPRGNTISNHQDVRKALADLETL